LSNNCTFFLSSTFKDFQQERDLLHLKIIPAINEEASFYGQSVDVVDLRWGINTADYDISEKSSRILKICLDEIDNCRPYYIIFLGDRYGWIPQREEMCEVLKQKGIGDIPDQWSVTEMEINYELFLQNVDKNHVIICIRESLCDVNLGEQASIYYAESEDAKEKMTALKKKLTKNYGDNIIYYSASWNKERCCLEGLEHFEVLLKNKIIELLRIEWSIFEGKDIYELVQQRTWREAERIVDECFIGTTDLNKLLSFASGTGGIYGVYGIGCLEKTALMAKLALRLRQEGKSVFILLCGRVPEVENKENLFDHIKAFVEHNDAENHYFIIDAIDNLVPDVDLQRYKIPYGASKNFLFISENHKYGSYFGVEKTIYYDFILSNDERTQLIERELNAAHKLVDKPIKDILKKCSANKSAFFIKMLIGRLTLIDRFDLQGCNSDVDINNKIADILISLPTEETSLFLHLCSLVASRMENSFCQRVIGLLGISKSGLRETDLEYIFKKQNWEWNTLYFSELKRYAKNLIEERAGRYYALTYRVPLDSFPSEIIDAFGLALDDDDLRNESKYAFYIREGLSFAFEHKDYNMAGKILQSFEKHPHSGYLFASLSRPIVEWALKCLECPEITAETCAAFGEQLSEISEHFAKDDMAMPTYQAMAVQCYIVANSKTERIDWLKSINANIGKLVMSLGAHWMNDLPEALPPFYQLHLECSKRLIELGAYSRLDYLKDQARFYPSIIYFLGDNSVKYTMDFIDWKPLPDTHEYIFMLVNAIHELFQLGYRCKTYTYSDGKNEMLDGFYKMELMCEKEKMFTLGMGNQSNCSLNEILSYMDLSLRASCISYLQHLENSCSFSEWLENEKAEKLKEKYKSEKRCQHCGGKFHGIINKICSACKKPKDY